MTLKTVEDWKVLGDNWCNQDWIPTLNNMHNAITELDLWDFMAQDIESYMFSSDPCVTKISMHPLVQESGHSGATFGICMRMMQRIAKLGWDGYVREEIKATQAKASVAGEGSGES